VREAAEKPKRQLVRSELNLEQNPVFTVSTYRKKSREITVKEVSPTGEVSERKVIIGKTVDGIETGVLTTHHFRVYLVLIKFWEEAGRPINDPVHFTILKILKEIGLADTGPNYETVKRILRHLVQIPLTFENSFFIPKKGSEQGGYKTLEDFHVLSDLYIYERKKVGKIRKIRGYGEFQFSKPILENLVNNHTHPLRLDVITSFKKRKELAILLYTYIDRNLAFKDKYEVRLEKLFDHLDLSQNYVRSPSDRKVKIEPVLKELEGKPLSTGILSYCRVHKSEDGKDYKLVARKKPFERALEASTAEVPQLEPSKADLLTTLKEHGLTESQAGELLQLKEERVIRIQLEALAYRIKEYRSQGKEVNEAALLYRSIKENWSLPSSYLEAKAKEEREKRAKHYVLWHCRRYGCENFDKTIMSPKERGAPAKCPACGADITIMQEDYIAYPKDERG